MGWFVRLQAHWAGLQRNQACGAGADRIDQHGGVRQRHSRQLGLPGEVATPIMEKRPVPPSTEQRERMVQAQDMGQAILFVAQMPARTCVNELVISPTYNRFYLGGLETPPAK